MSGKACEEAIDRLFEFIDNELPADELRRIGEHLEECPPCEAELHINEKIKNVVNQCPREEAPEALRARILTTISQARAAEGT